MDVRKCVIYQRSHSYPIVLIFHVFINLFNKYISGRGEIRALKDNPDAWWNLQYRAEIIHSPIVTHKEKFQNNSIQLEILDCVHWISHCAECVAAWTSQGLKRKSEVRTTVCVGSGRTARCTSRFFLSYFCPHAPLGATVGLSATAYWIPTTHCLWGCSPKSKDDTYLWWSEYEMPPIDSSIQHLLWTYGNCGLASVTGSLMVTLGANTCSVPALHFLICWDVDKPCSMFLLSWTLAYFSTTMDCSFWNMKPWLKIKSLLNCFQKVLLLQMMRKLTHSVIIKEATVYLENRLVHSWYTVPFNRCQDRENHRVPWVTAVGTFRWGYFQWSYWRTS